MPTPIEQLEAANEQIKTLEASAAQTAAQIEQLGTDLAAANERATASEAKAADLEAKLAEKSTALDAQAAELAAMTERATAAEGKLALDPAHTHISGRTAPVAGGAAGDAGGFLAKYEAITDRKERRAFYETHREQILAEQRQQKEQSK